MDSQRKMTDSFLIEISQKYLNHIRNAEKKHPLNFLADYYEVPKATVRYWVKQARQKGHLPQPIGQGHVWRSKESAAIFAIKQIRQIVFNAWDSTSPCPDGNHAGDFCPSCLAEQIQIQITRILNRTESQTND